MLEASQLQKMVIEDESVSIKLSKPGPEKITVKETTTNSPAESTAAVASPNSVSLYQASNHSSVQQHQHDITGHAIHSPMVGTFYRAPAPGAKTFVEVGKAVQKGDVICIVEAMKMMNQIKADKAGTVSAILVEDGEPVEYGQPLVTIG